MAAALWSILRSMRPIQNPKSKIQNDFRSNPSQNECNHPAQAADAWDPFAAVPSVAEGVEAREDSRGMLQVRGMSPRKPGLASSLARRFGLLRPVRVNLDAYGTAFWRQIDGRRSLRDIECVIRQQTQQDQKESEKATILFTKMLMLRHLIYLAVPKQENSGG